MPELRPCPICGGSALSVEFEESVEGVAAVVICEDCDAGDETRGPWGKPCATEAAAQAEAIRAWNRFALGGRVPDERESER